MTKYKKIFLFLFTIWTLYVLALLIRQNEIYGIETTDSYFYLKIAENSAFRGKFTHPVYSPGYPYFISAMLHLGIETELAGRIISFIFGAGIIILIFIFLKIILVSQNRKNHEGEVVALFSSVFLATNPKFVWACYSTLPYTTSTFFMWISILLSLIINQSERKNISSKKMFLLSALSGFFSGISYVIRPEMLITFFIFIAITRKPKLIIPFILGFTISSLPYHITSYKEGNLPSFLSKLILYRGGSLSEGISISQDNIEKILTLQGYIKNFIFNFHLSHKYAIPGILTASELIIIGLGISKILKESKESAKLSLLIVIIWCLFTFPIAISADYFYIPVLPSISLFGGYGLYQLWDSKNKYAKLGFMAFFIALNTAVFSQPLYKDEGRKIYKIAGKWIKENFGSESILIFEPFPFATFYAGGEWTTSPSKAKIWVISSLDYLSSRGKPELMILDMAKIKELSFAEPITEIKYKSIRLRIFKPSENSR
jgi:hypothetical protein